MFNLLGPLLLGAAVANTIATIVEVPAGQTVEVVGAALTAAVTWNLFTWRRLPSSSSHALAVSPVFGFGATWAMQRGAPARAGPGHHPPEAVGAAGAVADRRAHAGTALWMADRPHDRTSPVPDPPPDGLISQTSSAAVILSASLLSATASTTQVVASSVVGVGVGRHRYRHVGWKIVGNILLAWVTTLPAAAWLAAVFLAPWKWLA